MPRALTEEEKGAQRQRLLDKGKDIVLLYGVRKVSIDNIAKAAGLAKGTFYQHFASKEKYLYAMIEKIHKEAFAQAAQFLAAALSNGGDFREVVRSFLQQLFFWPEMVFFIRNEPEIELVFGTMLSKELRSLKQMEESLFEGILRMAHLDLEKVKPGVVHNYIHALFLIKSSEYMVEDDVPKTMDLIMESLISYVFGGV